MNPDTVRNIDFVIVILSLIFVVSMFGVFISPEDFYLPAYSLYGALFCPLFHFILQLIFKPWKKLADEFWPSYENFHIWSMTTVIGLNLGGIWLSYGGKPILLFIYYWVTFLFFTIFIFIKNKDSFIYDVFDIFG